MSKINEIQAAILALEGGAYQKLVDQYLHKKYHFENIQPFGVQNATNKSTKGIPDTYVIHDEKFILICYGTVSEQPADKIKRDIEDCINVAKTSIDTAKIAKIICCYTSANITPKQCEDLMLLGGGIEVELIGLGTLSHDLANNYRNIAVDHLQIRLDTHQIFEIEDFVLAHDKSGTNSPINTKFCFREDDLERVVDSIANNNITVISGPSGIGKTRLALEACRVAEKEGWKAFCVRSNGELLYNDIDDCLNENENCILFFDDANTITQLKNVLDECYTHKDSSQIKVLLTVRDYAKKQILLETNKYSRSEEISLGQLKDDEIKSILKENYNIRNHEYLDKICQVAKGNIRLAVLAGIRSVESGLPSISNSEDIFKNYYNPIIDKIGVEKKDLILLGIISFFGAVRIDNNVFYQILTEQYLGNDYSRECIERLYGYELIDIFENDILRISDQSLGNYILYYIVYKKKWIDLCDLIEESIPHNTKLIINLINMLLNLFRSDDLEILVKNSVNESWNKAESGVQKDYLYLFYPLNLLKGLLYLKNYVHSSETREIDLRSFDYDSKKNTNCINTKEIEILAGYKHTQYYEDAILLLLTLYEKRPDLFMDFYFAITNYLIFDKYTYRVGYSQEQMLIDKLWEKCENGENYNFTILYLRIAEYALNTEYTYTENGGNKTFSIVRMQVLVNDELKNFRACIWKSVTCLYDKPDYHDLSRHILNRIHVNGLYDVDYKELCCSDYNNLYAFLTKDTPVPFDKAMIIGEYKDAYTQLDIETDDRFIILENCKEYWVYKTLSKEFYEDCTYKESEQRRKRNIDDLIKNYTHEEYKSLFETCLLFEKQDDDNRWSIKSGLEIVFSILEKDITMFCDVVRLYLSKGAPFNIRPTNIVYHLLSNIGYDKTKALISVASEDVINEWYAELLSLVPENDINDSVVRDYIAFQEQELAKEKATIIPLRNIKKYLPYDESYLTKIVSYLLEHPEGIAIFLENAYGDEQVQIICESFSDNMYALVDLYFACDYKLFDYKDQLFWALYDALPESVWEKYINGLRDDYKIQQSENRAFAHVWDLPEYERRIDYAFSVLFENVLFPSESLFSVLFANSEGDPLEKRKKEWILNKLRDNSGNIDIVNKILDGVNAVYSSWKADAIVEYLKFDQDIDHFKQLHLLPMSESWSGSEIPVINRRIASLESIRDSLYGLEYIDHKAYIDDLIRSKEKYREEVKRQEYLEENGRLY